jgi:hypothetical protein
MDKKPLLGASICAMVLLILCSLSSVVGYHSVTSPPQGDSPLFHIRSQRMRHQGQILIPTHYRGQENGIIGDTTPPVTFCTLDPPEPDGENGWYISRITITLNAIDENSGVNVTYYQIDGGIWKPYSQPFNITTDCSKHIIKYFSIDYAGNTEQTNNVTFAMDHTKPSVFLSYTITGGNGLCGWVLTFCLTASDETSKMNRAEFYINEKLQETVYGLGPDYGWDYYGSSIKIRGFIRDPEMVESFVKFYAILVMVIGFIDPNLWYSAIGYDNAGNWMKDEIEHPSFRVPIKPGFYLFQNMTIPNNYTGYIGRYIIRAEFNTR